MHRLSRIGDRKWAGKKSGEKKPLLSALFACVVKLLLVVALRCTRFKFLAEKGPKSQFCVNLKKSLCITSEKKYLHEECKLVKVYQS